MNSKTKVATRNAKTGSITMRVPKSATTGTFVVKSAVRGRIELRPAVKKAS